MNFASKINKTNVTRNIINNKLPIKLGYGAFGTVYLNKDKRNNLYALKKSDNSLNKKYITIAHNEIDVLSKFNYKRIPKLYKSTILINENNTFDYKIYMEYFNGYDLYDGINKKILDLNVLNSFKYIKDISETLNYIHKLGYIYCDLKLENIIITDDGAKLVDFGQVRIKDKINVRPFGTLTYTPIECLSSYNNFTEKSDYWCLGIILILLIYNVHPFISEHSNTNDVYFRIKNSEKIINNIFENKYPVVKIDNVLLKHIQEIILNLMNSDINKRYGYNDLKNNIIWNYVFNKSYNDIV